MRADGHVGQAMTSVALVLWNRELWRGNQAGLQQQKDRQSGRCGACTSLPAGMCAIVDALGPRNSTHPGLALLIYLLGVVTTPSPFVDTM